MYKTTQFNRVGILTSAVILVGIANSSSATDTGYQTPPQVIADLIDAPPTPSVSIGPHGVWMLVMDRPSLAPISELAADELRLAGLRIDPATNGRSRRSFLTGLTFQNIATGQLERVKGLPDRARIQSPGWSPDGQRVAFMLATSTGLELWAVGVNDTTARRLGTFHLNGSYGSAFSWMPDSSALICRIVPPQRSAAPAAHAVPVGPVIQQTTGRKAPARTYQDLLKNEHDARLFEHYVTSQLVHVSMNGTSAPIGRAGLISRASTSPDGAYLLVETMKRPFSYIVPASRFPRTIDVWTITGRPVYQVADVPLADEIPIGFGSVRTGRRAVGWRADTPATLYWAEALDGGDPRKESDYRDAVFSLAAPFDGAPVELVKTPLRYGGITWGHDHLALVDSWWWSTRKEQTFIIDPANPGSEPRLLHDRSFEDRYNDPGSPMTQRNEFGRRVLVTTKQGTHLFYSGTGASPEGNRPFFDRLSLSTLKPERLWRSESPYYESVIDLINTNTLTLITRRESQTDPPNYYIRTIDSTETTRLTDFPHPMPQMVNIHKEMIHYQREDGVKLNATLYLPPGKKATDGPFPMLMWAYPQEFKSADAAGQVTDSPYRFVRVSTHSPLHWLMMGYAVLDDPSLPIVGEGDDEPNDTYIEQLVAGARAAVDEVVRRGVADPRRIAIGGHSYGAFMTANLLAHSDLFCAGIARSGAYNRTLTPFSFQSEERTFWEAPDVYMRMSPFTHAHRVNEPILLIHGAADNNSGTFPMQSERYYAALKGHGATARLVMLPLESHGYRARESIGHMAWEMTDWLERYVKNRPSEAPATEDESTGDAIQ